MPDAEDRGSVLLVPDKNVIADPPYALMLVAHARIVAVHLEGKSEPACQGIEGLLIRSMLLVPAAQHQRKKDDGCNKSDKGLYWNPVYFSAIPAVQGPYRD